MLPVLAGGMILGGLYGAAKQKLPKFDMSAMDEAYRLIEKQTGQVEEYYKEAGGALEQQYGNLYGQTIQDVVNAMATAGIYDSPVSQSVMARQQQALGETYATAKSKLAGERLSALGAIDQQRVAYKQQLANIQYQQALAKQQKKAQVYGAIGGIGRALLGA